MNHGTLDFLNRQPSKNTDVTWNGLRFVMELSEFKMRYE